MKVKIEKQRITKIPSTNTKTSTDNEIDAIKTTIQNMIRKNRENTERKLNREYENKIAHDEDELLSSVEEGWSIVKELSNGKVILCRNQSRASG